MNASSAACHSRSSATLAHSNEFQHDYSRLCGRADLGGLLCIRPALIGREAACPDRASPFLDLALDEFLQIVRRAPLGPGQIRAELSQPRLYGCGLDGRDTGGIEL